MDDRKQNAKVAIRPARKAVRKSAKANRPTKSGLTSAKRNKNLPKPVTTQLLNANPKRYGAIDEHGVLHEQVLKALAALAREKEMVEEKLAEFTSDLYIYGAKFYPDWTIEDREQHARYLNDAKETLHTVCNYDWNGPTFPELKAMDAWNLYNKYCSYHRYNTLKAQNRHDDFWSAAAEITGFQKAKDAEDYICSTAIAEAFKTRDLITDVLLEFKECEDDGKYQKRKERTEAIMNGSHMDFNAPGAIRKGDKLKLEFVAWDARYNLLAPGKLVAVDSESEEEGRMRSYFSVGWLTKYDPSYDSSHAVHLRYANGNATQIDLREVKAIYLVHAN